MGKSSKLLVGEKSFIVNKLLAPHEQHLESVKKEKVKELENFLRASYVPKEILELEKKFPESIQYMRYTSVGDGRSGLGYYNVNLECPVFPSYQDIFRTDPKIVNLATRLKEETKEVEKAYTTLESKLECVIYSINSPKKLREEFPEAYQIWEELQGVRPKDIGTLKQRAEEIQKLIQENLK